MPMPPPPNVPDVLLLAEKGARAMGNQTRLVEIAKGGRDRGGLLVVMHGDQPALVREQMECISVFILMDIPDELVVEIAKLPSEYQKRLEVNLRGALLSHGRTAFALWPIRLRSIGELRRISIEQTLRISEEDPSSFNRYADAIQEVVTTTARVSKVLAPLFASGGDSGGTSADKGVPPGMYT